MTMLKDLEAVCPLESCACTVKEEVPATVGVPEIVPELSDKPVGSEPERMDQEYGEVPPVAVSAAA